MNESFERFKDDAYPEIINSQIIQFRMFGIESIDEQLNNDAWTLAHQEFNGRSIPNLISSELYYQPAATHYTREVIIGSVTATAPHEWHQLSTISILDELKKYVDKHNAASFIFSRPLSTKYIEVFDENGIGIGTIDCNKNRSEVTIAIDVELESPNDKIEYYNSVRQSVELWGYLHDFIAQKGETKGIPLRYIYGDPQHQIYIGGARPLPTTIEMELITILEDIHLLDSEQPTPTLGDIDFEEVDASALALGIHDVVTALKYVIAEKRIFYRHTKFVLPISTAELVYAMNRQQELLRQSSDENNHHG